MRKEGGCVTWMPCAGMPSHPTVGNHMQPAAVAAVVAATAIGLLLIIGDTLEAIRRAARESIFGLEN